MWKWNPVYLVGPYTYPSLYWIKSEKPLPMIIFAHAQTAGRKIIWNSIESCPPGQRGPRRVPRLAPPSYLPMRNTQID